MARIDADDMALLADLECPECGPLVDEAGDTFVSPQDFDVVFAEDKCPDCGADLEPTLDAALGMLQLIAERMPEQAGAIAEMAAKALSANQVADA